MPPNGLSEEHLNDFIHIELNEEINTLDLMPKNK